MKVACCGKSATPYKRHHGDHSTEEGRRCLKCGRIRIPDPQATQRIQEFWDAQQPQRDQLHREGVQWDASLKMEI